ncbi:MAG: DUF1697 domain-containing protein [Chloroflexi bacterium]|nr:DUF1697 domain-containing protein [Chloroflexota bacterium]
MRDECAKNGAIPPTTPLLGDPTSWVALLRGVKVRGTQTLLMDVLARVISATGLRSVRTYIRTGSIVFRHPETDASDLSARITRAITDQFGLKQQQSCFATPSFVGPSSGCPLQL